MELDNPRTWDSAYEDSQIVVKINPIEPQGYCICLESSGEYFFLARGCLSDIALVNRDQGGAILDQLFPHRMVNSLGNELTKDSLLAAIAMTYIREERRREIQGERERELLERNEVLGRAHSTEGLV
ncbi:MAG: hypothetical protein KKC19_02255 [Nanoarchaeota archaeon]|nr:hypothetical protein [Nanoarchaeota archaeon]